MAIRLGIIGVDGVQRDWVEALRLLRAKGAVEIVGAGHRSVALAKDLADQFRDTPGAATAAVPAFDDLRTMFVQTSPQVILLDRPENVSAEMLAGWLRGGVGIFSLGPPVRTVAEARHLAGVVEPRTGLLYVWPRLGSAASYRHCAVADEFVRPVRFARATWFAFNHALAKSSGRTADAVRSMSVLAWDAFAALIELMGVPESVYASVRGTVASGVDFADLSGSAGMVLRFADGCTASVALSDRVAPWRRELLLIGQSGTLELDERGYRFADAEGKVIDEGYTAEVTGVDRAMQRLGEFFEQFGAQPSPGRGWEHRLEAVAATMEAMMVSQRTGQAESPERFLGLRR